MYLLNTHTIIALPPPPLIYFENICIKHYVLKLKALFGIKKKDLICQDTTNPMQYTSYPYLTYMIYLYCFTMYVHYTCAFSFEYGS